VGKLLFWAVLLLAVFFGARLLASHNKRHDKSTAAKRPPTAMSGPEPMVRCAHCHIHLPRSEAVLMHGETWCTIEHAKLGESKKT